ncbi:hypothetical protein LY90DRAFT_223782 [Neocallimastix californiae]|uniref:ABC transporter domain-containing protein n=1 Tax=Neocallimastix californiae TaxID=1754190 RepID=A0A1Y2E2B8_9FUNG|nr:hypothetical protein LY90DRAFT_223782 [Neocallimastix californiae]|eukprot:ORY65682.1 hypothetical protein LY90DRAFT_223782 [Neocallimastix californiae]
MLRKTLSYQKRQIKTNLCCVAACPTMMIVTAFLLSLLVEHFLKDLIKTEKFEYCTNEFNGHFVIPGADEEYKKDEPDVHICHYTGGSLFTGSNPCSFWFGNNDHFASAPYDIIPENSTENIQRDTLFIPPLDKEGNYPYIINKIKEATDLLQIIGNLGDFANKSGMGIRIKNQLERKEDKEKEEKRKKHHTIKYNNNNNNENNENNNENNENNENNNENNENNENNNENNDNEDKNNNGDKNIYNGNDIKEKIETKTKLKSKREIDFEQFGEYKEVATIKYITDNLLRPWGFVALNKNNATDKAIVGERLEGPMNMTLEELNSDHPTLTNRGLLDYTSTRYFLNIDELMNSVKVNPIQPDIFFQRIPFFEVLEVENDDDLDDLLVKRMELVNKVLSNTSFDSYTEEEKKQINLDNYKDPEDAIKKSVDLMPYGILYMKEIDEVNLNYDTLIAVGENNRLASLYSCEVCDVTPYMTYPGRGKRLIYFLTELSNAVIRKMTNGTSTITQGFRSFPEKYTSELPIDLAGLIGIVLYPWGVSFLIPTFVIGLVKEKEERYLVMMNMNGMRSYVYYIFVYLTNLILSLISMFFFVITGLIVGLFMFTRTSMIVLIILLFIWSNIQVIVSFVMSLFFKRNSTALIASFLVVLLSIVFSLSLMKIFSNTYVYFIWPLFGFYYILMELSSEAVSKNNPAYQLHNFHPGNRVFNTTMILIFDFFLFCILAFYLSAVLPQEYGKHQPWHLNIIRRIKKWAKWIKRKTIEGKKGGRNGERGKDESRDLNMNNDNDNDNDNNNGNDNDNDNDNNNGNDNDNDNDNVSSDDSDLEVNLKDNPFYTEEEAEEAKALEDDDVRAERERVLSGHYVHGSPLVIKNIRKEYPPRSKGGNPHVAVHSVTFAVEEGIVFGLLGPNGAGKTTLIHSLIGVYTPTNGYARLAGYNIQTDMDQVYKRIGICPQHDILWNDLTVLEHLLFYARLKGIPKDQEYEAVQESMESVGLKDFRDNLVHGLSGGERRRLSIAIALVGNPKLVFLDEPTTGLDPDVRRLIWSILDEVSHDRTIILTTHSMEEAEVLCHRIGIMSHGTLRCCAALLRLKELYGSGFKLSYSNRPENYRELKEFILQHIPEEHKVVRDLASNSIYEFIPPQGLISQLFTLLEENKEKYGIIDWGISQSSLEEVFLSIISEDDADAS